MRHITTQSQSAQSRGVSPRTGPARPGSLRVRRSGFTLMELLIVITIMLLLTFITSKVVNSVMEGDRVPGGARQVQSFLEGARNRAIYSTKTLNPGPRGVRFLRDPNNPDTVTSMVYIGPPQKYSEGLLEIGTGDPNDRNYKRRIRVRRNNQPYNRFNTLWTNIELRKLLLSGARIEIPRGLGIFYTIINTNTDPNAVPLGYPGAWELTKDYPASKFPHSVDYSLELEPAVLPNQEPRLLPKNVVIDVKQNFSGQAEHSRIPGFWSNAFRNRMDILFSPQGTIVGRSAIGGYIHLVLTDLADAEQIQNPFFTGDPRKEGDEKIVTVNTRTGSVTVHSVNLSFDANGNQVFPTDPFRFAETGEESE